MDSESWQEEVAKSGAWIGIIQPLYLGVIPQVRKIREVHEALRDAKMYELSDQLRKPLHQIELGLDYAFPSWRTRK